MRLDWGVVAKRAVVGVAAAPDVPEGRIEPNVRCWLGVAAPERLLMAAAVSVAEREGVRPRRSKRPRTRPSF